MIGFASTRSSRTSAYKVPGIINQQTRYQTLTTKQTQYLDLIIGLFLLKVFQRCLVAGPLHFCHAPSSGSEVTKVGKKVSGGGKVASEAGKKALGESMDTQIANLIKDTKEKKVPEKNPKVKDPKDAQAKELQKYIKRPC